MAFSSASSVRIVCAALSAVAPCASIDAVAGPQHVQPALMALPHVEHTSALDRPPQPLAPIRPLDMPRPAPLVPLYMTFAALQVLDIDSTVEALDRGYRESNPLMQPVSGNRGAMLAVKAGVTLGTIMLVERVWKGRHRRAAVLTMIGVNVGYGLIVASNYRRARAAP
jgi:hypothetical protein